MPRVYTPDEVIKVLESFGWTVARTTRTHVIMKMEGNPNNISIPTSRREVAIGTFRSNLRKAGIPPAEFDTKASEIL
jgi:predicted RNA binding protein YcfA (HicA-like mRNA interferase family)